MSCPTHPQYKGKSKPRRVCFYCWNIWAEAHPSNTLTAAETMMIMNSLHNKFHEWLIDHEDDRHAHLSDW